MEVELNNINCYTIKENGEVKQVTPQDGKQWQLEEMQQLVGGYIEAVSVPNTDYVMLVDEEGRYKRCYGNEKASELAQREIVGDVLIIPNAMFV